MRNDGGGAGAITSSTKSCVASGGIPLLAVNCNAKVPAPVGVPESSPERGLKVTPEGSAPDTASVGTGVPEARTVKLPATPT